MFHSVNLLSQAPLARVSRALPSVFFVVDESSVETLSSAFATDQLEKFQKRVDNGYDLFVENDFVAWLQLYHPHYLPSVPSDFLYADEHHPSSSVSGSE